MKFTIHKGEAIKKQLNSIYQAALIFAFLLFGLSSFPLASDTGTPD